MQKLADGHDTDAGSSPPWLWSRWLAAPQAGELAPGGGGADDGASHPVAAPMSRMNTQANASRSRPVRTVSEETVRPGGPPAAPGSTQTVTIPLLSGLSPACNCAIGPFHWAQLRDRHGR